MDVGFIGVGRLGTGMVFNLIKGGHKVFAHDISPEALARAKEMGATVCACARDVSEGRDAVFLSLMHPEALEDVVLGPEGVLSASRVPPLLIDTSTMPPWVIKRVAAAAQQKGCALLESPVSGEDGGPKAAMDGRLTLMVGGPVETYEKALPLLKLLGKEIFHLGDLGTGNAMKLVNNLLCQATRAVIAEAMMLGTLSGIEPRKIFDVVSVSSGNSAMFQYMAPRVLSGDFSPRGVVYSNYKALLLSSKMAEEFHLPMPMVNAAKEVFQAALASGLRDQEGASLITLYERLMGVEVRDQSPMKG